MLSKKIDIENAIKKARSGGGVPNYIQCTGFDAQFIFGIADFQPDHIYEFSAKGLFDLTTQTEVRFGS